MIMPNNNHYNAFLSYSRKDHTAAHWLHKKLDRYRTPKSLLKTIGNHENIPESLHPIFIDRADLPGGGRLSDRLNEKLQASDSLIVFCSPAAACSSWVNEEVKRFIELGKGDRIYPVISPNSPNSEDIEKDFFPPNLRNLDYLAVDLRALRDDKKNLIGDGRAVGLMKLTAGLLGVDQDVLVRREHNRQRKALIGLSFSVVLFFIVAILALWFGYQSHLQTIEQEKQTRTQAKLRGIAERRSENLTNSVEFYRNLIKEQADPTVTIKMGYLKYIGNISFTTCKEGNCRILTLKEMGKTSGNYYTILRESLNNLIKYKGPCFGACRFTCEDPSPFYILTRNEQECAIADINEAASHVMNLSLYRAKAGKKEVIGIQIIGTYWGRTFGGAAFPMVFLARDLSHEDAAFRVIGILEYAGVRDEEPTEEEYRNDDLAYEHKPDVIIKWLKHKDNPDVIVGETWDYPGSYKRYTSMYYSYLNEFSRYAGHCLANGVYDVGIVGKNEDGLINLINADLKDCSIENDVYDLGNAKSEDIEKNPEDPEEQIDEDESTHTDEN